MKNGKIIGAVAFLFAASGAVHAQQQDANAQRNALNKAQFLLKQATQEKTELQTQVDALKQQVDKLTKDLASTQTSADATKQKMQTGFNDTIELWKQRDAKQSEQASTLRAQLKDQSEQRAALEGKLKTQTENFSVCYGNNQQLLTINRELLSQYQNKGVFDAVRQKEPFTGVKEVEIENLVQDYRYKIDDLAVGAPAAEQQ